MVRALSIIRCVVSLFASLIDSQKTVSLVLDIRLGLFAISSSNAAPLDTLDRLIDSARQSPVYTAKPYIESSFKDSLRFYLVVHDASVKGHDLER